MRFSEKLPVLCWTNSRSSMVAIFVLQTPGYHMQHISAGYESLLLNNTDNILVPILKLKVAPTAAPLKRPSMPHAWSNMIAGQILFALSREQNIRRDGVMDSNYWTVAKWPSSLVTGSMQKSFNKCMWSLFEQETLQPWWAVDLGKEYTVKYIKIYTRDCCRK